MSKRAYISRYMLLLKKLKAKPHSTYEELRSYIEIQVEYLQMQDESLNIAFSKRTFQRDIREISNIFGIDIEYSKKEQGYFISYSESENMNFQRMMEAYDLFNSLNLAQDLSPFIFFEKHRSQGTENLYGLLYAIKNRFQIKFEYHKFWEEEISHRKAEPYALKEYKYRWYVFAKDLADNNIKSFALDRLSNLEISHIKFIYPEEFDFKESYKYCFGKINPGQDEEPVEIILSFDPIQGKYIKSLPLHESQVALVDTDDEFRIKLHLFVTHELIMELLSFGERLTVLKPESLKNEIKEALLNAFNNYK